MRGELLKVEDGIDAGVNFDVIALCLEVTQQGADGGELPRLMCASGVGKTRVLQADSRWGGTNREGQGLVGSLPGRDEGGNVAQRLELSGKIGQGRPVLPRLVRVPGVGVEAVEEAVAVGLGSQNLRDQVFAHGRLGRDASTAVAHVDLDEEGRNVSRQSLDGGDVRELVRVVDKDRERGRAKGRRRGGEAIDRGGDEREAVEYLEKRDGGVVVSG